METFSMKNLTVVALCLVSMATATSLANTTFHRKGANGFIYIDDLVFESPAKSKLDCLRQCFSYDPCVAFTFVPALAKHSLGLCRAHSTDVTSLTSPSTLPSQGAMTYNMKGRRWIDWLNVTCTTTAQCESLDAPYLTNAECFVGRCLCIPGYYYSLTENTCLDSCPEERLASSYIRYVDCGITGHNEVVMYEPAPEACLPNCTALSWCRSIDIYLIDGKCHFQLVGALDDPPSWNGNKPGVNYFQRMCQ